MSMPVVAARHRWSRSCWARARLRRRAGGGTAAHGACHGSHRHAQRPAGCDPGADAAGIRGAQGQLRSRSSSCRARNRSPSSSTASGWWSNGAWGARGLSDGALLIIAKDDHTLRIEVGYGLEGALNDAVCERIISEIITPTLPAGRSTTAASPHGIARHDWCRGWRAVAGAAAAFDPAAGGGLQYLPDLGALVVVAWQSCQSALRAPAWRPGDRRGGRGADLVSRRRCWYSPCRLRFFAFLFTLFERLLAERAGVSSSHGVGRRRLWRWVWWRIGRGFGGRRLQRWWRWLWWRRRLGRAGSGAAPHSARHLLTTHWQLRRAFSPPTLSASKRPSRTASASTPASSASPSRVRCMGGGCCATRRRQRALELFAGLHMWDTEHRNGVLIYLLLADRAVEIVVDRGAHRLVDPEVWQQICRQMESEFRAGRYQDGVLQGIRSVTAAMRGPFPGTGTPSAGCRTLPSSSRQIEDGDAIRNCFRERPRFTERSAAIIHGHAGAESYAVASEQQPDVQNCHRLQAFGLRIAHPGDVLASAPRMAHRRSPRRNAAWPEVG